MARGPLFVDREVFLEILASTTTTTGDAYEDVETIYGDMARLVVGWLARSTPAEINATYNEVGWKGSANGRALHEAARAWMKAYHPDRLLPDERSERGS